ncbi:MAG: ThiF family adenylyltransferase [Myxococcota bacterium]
MTGDRYARQRALPQIGDEGQERLSASTVIIIGCGALGCAQAQLLARAGVGVLRLVDRDFVELSNLHRQLLFDEQDALRRRPKAEAAALHLEAANSDVVIEPLVRDVDASNVLEIIGHGDLVLDATDNVETRYLLNDACVSIDMPWVYGGAAGTQGLVMPVLPGSGPCLRCVFREPPPPGSLPTLEAGGVLNTGPALIAALQATVAQQILVGASLEPELLSVDLWQSRFRSISVRREPDCPCCGQESFDFLSGRVAAAVTVLEGEDAVRISPAAPTLIDLAALAQRLPGDVQARLEDDSLQLREGDHELVLFPDGSVVVKGTTEPVRARILHARFIGT